MAFVLSHKLVDWFSQAIDASSCVKWWTEPDASPRTFDKGLLPTGFACVKNPIPVDMYDSGCYIELLTYLDEVIPNQWSISGPDSMLLPVVSFIFKNDDDALLFMLGINQSKFEFYD